MRIKKGVNKMFGDMTYMFMDYEERIEKAKEEVDNAVECGEPVDIHQILDAYDLNRASASDIRYIMKNMRNY